MGVWEKFDKACPDLLWEWIPSRRIIVLGSMHLLGCYGCSAMVPQIDDSGRDSVRYTLTRACIDKST